jgi:3-phytase
MGLFSKYPIDTVHIRTFQKFLWKDLTGHHIPSDFYDDAVVELLRLSSKSHWDVPVLIRESKVHLLICHPTPPVFDGEEDRNGRRNFDEIKFWVQYLADDSFIYDDQNKFGGFTLADPFIITGDLNASLTSDSRYDGMVAIEQLIKHPKIKDSEKWLISNGGWAGRSAGPPDYWERTTAQFGRDFRTRIDYLLVSKDIDVTKGGVFWPSESENSEGNRLAQEASDHRLIWLDIVVPD